MIHGMKALLAVVCCGWAATLSAQVIDSSESRVQTTLDPGLKRIGTLKPKSVHQIGASRWTLGCETIDREYSDYGSFKEYLPALGIKRIRLQGGWARTEKTPGIYDFAWLDYIIDDARSRGLEVWLETGYGNPVYPGAGGRTLNGGFPSSEEGLAAWDRWVEAMATRYKSKVRDWAMWNEPDINKQHKPEAIAAFNIRTAEIIKRVIPDARIAGLSLASSSPKLLESCLKALGKKVDLFHWFIYHGYDFNPDKTYKNVEALKATLAKYSTTAKMRQGENGCPSEKATRFALSNHPWTESSQAKWDTRRMLGDLGHDVESSVFTICDFNHTGREINRKGLLWATADKKVEKIKLAYYSVQNVAAVFDETLERIPEPGIKVTYDKATACFAYRKKATGQNMIVLWDNSGTPDDAFVTRPAQVEVKGLAIREPVWVDMVSGRIYEIPATRIKTENGTTFFKDLPLYDAPVLIAERTAVMPPKTGG